MDLWLVQYLCTSRHALAAVPYDRDERSATDAETMLLEESTRVGLQPICGLCGSLTLHFEHGKLPYPDWETALMALFAVERWNIETRMMVDRSKHSRS